MAESGHDDDCGCVRCIGMRPGNTLALKHGAYAVVHLAGRAEEIAAKLWGLVPLASIADSAAIDALALTLAQLERANVVLSRHQIGELEALGRGEALEAGARDDLRRLSQDARAWTNTALRYLDALGLTVTSRARLGLDVVRAEDALERLAAEGRLVRERAQR